MFLNANESARVRNWPPMTQARRPEGCRAIEFKRKPGMTIKTFSALAGAVLLSLTVSGNAFAMDGAALYKTKTCFSCHGQDANTPILPIYPRLAGQNAEYALNQMKDIKSGARANGQTAAMKGVMHLVSDEEMKAIAEWLSTL